MMACSRARPEPRRDCRALALGRMRNMAYNQIHSVFG